MLSILLAVMMHYAWPVYSLLFKPLLKRYKHIDLNQPLFTLNISRWIKAIDQLGFTRVGDVHISLQIYIDFRPQTFVQNKIDMNQITNPSYIQYLTLNKNYRLGFTRGRDVISHFKYYRFTEVFRHQTFVQR